MEGFLSRCSRGSPKKEVGTNEAPVTVRVYVDANHAGKMIKRTSHPGILIYVKNALVNFYSKIKNTV